MTSDSRFLRRALRSGSLLCTHSHSEWEVAKQSLHLRALDARPKKFTVNKVALMVDHFLFLVSATWHRNAVS